MKHLLLLVFLIGSFDVFPQKKLKKDEKEKDSIIEIVNVVTSYIPTLADAFKIRKTPKVILRPSSKKQALNYTIFSAPVASTFVPKSGVLKGIDVGRKERLFENYLSVGFGNFTTPSAEIFLHQNKKFENDFGLYLKYLSSANGVKSSSLNSGFSDISFGGYYKQEARNSEWKIGIDSYQKKYNWYGLPSLIIFDDNHIDAIQEKQTYGLYKLKGEYVFYDSYLETLKTSVSFFSDFYGSEEIKFSLNPSLNLPLYRIQGSLSDLVLHTSIDYLQGKFRQNYANESKISHRFFNLGVQPSYKFEWNRIGIQLGTKIYLGLDLENKLTHILSYPDVEITYPVVSNTVNLSLGARGDLYTNSFQKIISENPFVSPTLFLTQTNQQYNLFAGMSGMFSSRISFNIETSYKSDEDHLLFVRNNSKSDGQSSSTPALMGYEFGNSFSIFYDDLKTLSIFAEMSVDLNKQVTIGASLESNSYTTTFQQEAWNLPKFQSALYGSYKNDQWYATTHIFLVGERKDLFYSGVFPSTIAGVQSLEGFIDLNLNGGYHFSDFFSVFVKLNNVLDKDYQRFANFNVMGFQAIAGITYKFDF